MRTHPQAGLQTALQTGRRTVLAGGVGAAALLVAGCSLNNPFNEDHTPAAEAVRRLDPDIAVAVQAVASIDAALRLVQATTGRHAALRPSLQPLIALHQAHRAALVRAVPHEVDLHAGQPAPAVAARAPIARQRVVAAERTLQGQLRGFTLRAESGPFARLLASMDAAVGQHLVAGRLVAA